MHDVTPFLAWIELNAHVAMQIWKELGTKNATEADSGDMINSPHFTFRKIAHHEWLIDQS